MPKRQPVSPRVVHDEEDVVITREQHHAQRREERRRRRQKRAQHSISLSSAISMDIYGNSALNSRSGMGTVSHDPASPRSPNTDGVRGRRPRPSELEEASGEGRPLRWQTVVAFFVFAMGPGWVLDTALYQQMPWFQSTQSEGLKLASQMTIAGILSMPFLILPYIFINSSLPKGVSHMLMISILCFAEAILTFLVGILWSVSANGVSFALLGTSFFASGIGGFQSIVVLPWISQEFNPRIISIVLTGSHFGNVLTSLLGLAQSPGGARRFTPTVFFMILFTILICPVVAYYRKNLLARKQGTSPSPSLAEFKGMVNESNSRTPNPQRQLAPTVSNSRPHHFHAQQIEGSAPGDSHHHALDGNPVCELENMEQGQIIEERHSDNPKSSNLCASIQGYLKAPLGWRKVIPHAAANGLIKLLAWSLLRAIAPYAAYHTKHHHNTNKQDIGGSVLAMAIEISHVTLTVGSAISYFLPSNQFLTPCLILIGTFLLLSIMASDQGDWSKSEGAPVLILCICVIRFIDGYTTPLIYRDIAKIHPENRESLSRWVAIVEKVVTFCGAWVAFALIETDNIAD
ncbi:hypothetical protein AAMO2058_000334000 [Amorphochlora amoebiformis]